MRKTGQILSIVGAGLVAWHLGLSFLGLYLLREESRPSPNSAVIDVDVSRTGDWYRATFEQLPGENQSVGYQVEGPGPAVEGWDTAELEVELYDSKGTRAFSDVIELRPPGELVSTATGGVAVVSPRTEGGTWVLRARVRKSHIAS